MCSISNKTTTPNMESDADKNHDKATTTKVDIIGNLLPELVKKILFYLTPEDLRSAASCCSRWKFVILDLDDSFWKKLCLLEGYLEVETSHRSKFYTNFLERYNHYWQGVYWYNYTVEKNWENGVYRDFTRVIKEPHNTLCSWFFDDIFVVRCMHERKLFVYNLKTTEVQLTIFSFRQEPGGNGKILKSGKYLSYFLKYESLTVWDYENKTRVLNEFWGHVTDVYVFKNLFVLEAQYNETLQVFNIESRQIEYETRGILQDMVIMDGRMVFLTQDNVVHILNWSDKSLVTLMHCSYQKLEKYKFLVKNDLFLSLRKDNNSIQALLCGWNITTKTKLYSINLEIFHWREASFLNNYLYVDYFQTIDDDGNLMVTFKLIDYTKGTVIATVTDIHAAELISNDQFIIARRWNKISLWCLKTRDFICDDLNLDLSLKNDHVRRSNFTITKTKLAYAKKLSFCSLSLYVRDYEI